MATLRALACGVDWKLQAARLFGALSLVALASSAARAQEVTVSYLQGQLKRATDNVTVFGPDLMGDQVNLYTGALEFVHVDTQLPGNSALRVAFSRRHTAGRTVWIRTRMGDWDYESPRIGATFSFSRGWVNSQNNTARCSDFSPPPVAYAYANGGGPIGNSAVVPGTQGGGAAPAGREPSTYPFRPTIEYTAREYWHGVMLQVPGHGSQEVLKRNPSDSVAPGSPSDYPLVTRDHWQLQCLPSIQNGSGEGFMAISPEGVRYRFDWQVTTHQPPVRKEGAGLARVQVDLMATEVLDRFGNWVRYHYDPVEPSKLMQIEASDGRFIDLTYDVNGRVRTVSDRTRSWVYEYSTTGELRRVTQADGTYWEFDLRPMVHLNSTELGELADCDRPGYFPEVHLTGSVRHPSGAMGIFETAFVYHSRSNVPRQCTYVPNGSTPKPVSAILPKTVGTQAIVAKTISGPGLADAKWSYEYQGTEGSWAPCNTSCGDTRTVLVTDPEGGVTRYTFGNRFQETEGQLLSKEEGWSAGAVLRSTTYRYRQPYGAYPEPAGFSIVPDGDFQSSRHRPEDQRIVVQQGTRFTREVAANGFDYFARVIAVSKRSTNALRQFAKTESTTFHDKYSSWVLGQVERVIVRDDMSSETVEVQRAEFDQVNALPTARYSFGRLVERLQHDSATGLLTHRFDPLGRATAYLNYSRGLATQVVHRDGTSESAGIDNLGNVRWHKNEAGYTTRFDYDVVGRLSLVDYPAEEAFGYYPSVITFAPQASQDRGCRPAIGCRP